MTMRVMDGFDYGSGGNQLTRGGWILSNTSGTFSTSVRRFGYGGSVIVGINNGAGNNGGFKIFDPYTEVTEAFFAGAMYRTGEGIYGNTGTQIGIGESSVSACHIMIRMCAPGLIKVYRGSNIQDMRNWNFTLIGQSDPDLFDNNSWNWFECYAKLDATAGEVEVRLNGRTVIHLVDIQTLNMTTGVPAYANMGFFGAGGNEDFTGYVDDFAVWDTAGTTCNTWMGTNRIKTMLAIADGTNIDSTIGGTAPAATHWQSVGNTAMDDTKYVYMNDTQVGDFDLYDLDPVISAPYVHAIQVRVSARQDDATQMVMRNLLESGGSTAEGPDVYLPQTYNFWYSRYEVNPATGVAFTDTEANAIQVGYKFEALIP